MVNTHSGGRPERKGKDMVIESTEAILVRVPEAGRLLSISRTSVYNLIEARELEVVHLGRAVRITMESIRAWVAKQRDPTRGAGGELLV